MFNRYTITALPSSIELKFNMKVSDQYHPRFNASPGQILPVILDFKLPEISMARWGLIPDPKNKKEIIPTGYVKDLESVKENKMWQNALNERRCLVLADGFYIWKSISKKSAVPYRVISKSEKIICFCGIWEEDEFQNLYFTIITRPAYKPIHQLTDRMPVVLTTQKEHWWLNPKVSLDSLFGEMEVEDWAFFKYYPVSPKIIDEKLNNPYLIKEAPQADQHGNLTLFD
jgi:putative SOS response-associated peptidase YedK